MKKIFLVAAFASLSVASFAGASKVKHSKKAALPPSYGVLTTCGITVTLDHPTTMWDSCFWNDICCGTNMVAEYLLCSC